MTPCKWNYLLALWMEVLKLNDRKITLKFVRASTIPDQDMDVSFTDRRAKEWLIKIRIGQPSIVDAETAFVHELMHIKMGLLDARDESGLWDVAEALVALKNAKA